MSQRKRHKWARSFKQQFWELNATQNTTVATDMEVKNTISTPPPHQQTERERKRERVEELRGKKKKFNFYEQKCYDMELNQKRF